MGKPKNKSKGQDVDDLSDTEVQVDDKQESESKPATKQSKKDKKKKKKEDDWEDDVANELATLSLEANKGNKDIDQEEIPAIVNKKEKKKKKKQKQEESEEEEGDDEIMPSYQKSKKQAAFSMLIMDDEGSADDMKSPSESEEEVKPVTKQEPTKKKKEKKKTKNKEEEDIDALLAEIDKPKEKSGKKSKKDRKKEANEENMEAEKVNGTDKHEGDNAVEKTEPKVVTMEDLENEEDDGRKKKKKKKGKDREKEEDNDNETESNAAEKSEPKVVTMEDLENEDPDEGKKKKKKKKGKEKTEEDEGNENETTEKLEPKVVTMEDLEDDDADDDKKKKKKKKGKDKKGEGEEAEGEEGEDEDAGEGTMKSAAQKRKEKKEREKEKRKAEKMKQAQKKDQEKPEEKKLEKEPSEEKEKSTEDEKKTEATGEDKASGDEAEVEGKKKKKDKKKKGEKEEKKDEKKKKTKAPISALKELLKKQKEEEERLQREEEERIRREEEAIAAAIEKKRLEEERKQKKKAKEKEKRERLKAEGKLLTAAQKADRRKAEQMLEMMRAQGIKVPNKDDAETEKRKRPVYGQVRRRKKQDQSEDSTAGDSGSREDTPTPTVDEEKPVAVEEEAKVEEEKEKETEEVAEEWDDDVKDEWDASSSEEESEEKESTPETETKVQVEIKSKEEVKKTEKEAEGESEEESDEEDESDEEESDSEEESETESDSDDDLTPYQRAEIKIKKRHEDCESRRSVDNLRAPVVCVLGHVDTGKTKILDKLRRTNVQDGEAGGITQQIGATNVPKQAILDKTSMCKEFQKKELKLPGLLIIDTPGHESFSNLRSRGSSLCDIAILVIDIMHGLEPQTIESINLLKDRKTPFVVALNKIDRLYQWKSNPNVDVVNTIKKQTPMCKNEFDERSQAAIVQLAEQGLNAALFYENKNPKEYISLVPTSAHSGDGMGNLLALICELTQTWLAKKVSYTEELHATVMEVKALPGLGTTIDVILVNGKLSEGDHIVIAGTEGPIVTQIRGLLMPQPMRELRVKAQYEHHKEVLAAQGVKIIGKDMEKALAGLPLYVAHNDDEIEYYKEELSTALKDVLSGIKLSERGVFVQASTLGSLEALLEFLRTSKIPYAGINIGPVHKKDIMKASIMLEHDSQWAVILAFDVKVERDAQEMADSLGVRIFTADIIYHLEDKFLKFREDLKRQKQEEFKHIAVFPCKLRVLPQFIFNQRDPIVVGVSVEAGIVKVGSPLCVPSKEFVEIGTISSIENNHKPQETARRGEEVCIKIENTSGDAPKLYGRHFDHTDLLVSKISRTSIDAVKEHFREDMTKQDWALMVELKKTFQIL